MSVQTMLFCPASLGRTANFEIRYPTAEVFSCKKVLVFFLWFFFYTPIHQKRYQPSKTLFEISLIGHRVFISSSMFCCRFCLAWNFYTHLTFDSLRCRQTWFCQHSLLQLTRNCTQSCKHAISQVVFKLSFTVCFVYQKLWSGSANLQSNLPWSLRLSC